MKKHGRNTDSLIQTGIDAGNINISDGEIILYGFHSNITVIICSQVDSSTQ